MTSRGIARCFSLVLYYIIFGDLNFMGPSTCLRNWQPRRISGVSV